MKYLQSQLMPLELRWIRWPGHTLGWAGPGRNLGLWPGQHPAGPGFTRTSQTAFYMDSATWLNLEQRHIICRFNFIKEFLEDQLTTPY